MDGERYRCRWCGEELVSGDVAWNNAHFVNHHIVDYIDELEWGGATELEAHRTVNELVESLRTRTG